MLTSISPLGERARGNTWWLTLGWLTLGAVSGGAILGGLLGTFGQLLPVAPGDWQLVAPAVSGIAAAGWDLAGRRFPVRRQVNEDWLSAFRRWVYGFGYGIQLGIAPMTVVSTGLVPLLMLTMFIGVDPRAGLVMGVLFGGTRALSLAVNRRVRTADDLRRLHRRMDQLAEPARIMGGAAAGLLAGASLLVLAA